MDWTGRGSPLKSSGSNDECPLPSLQAQWGDDSEMGFLYDRLPQPREADEDEWDTKFEFWQLLLAEYGALGPADKLVPPVFALTTMQSFFKRAGGLVPTSLLDIVPVLVEQDVLVDVQRLQADHPSMEIDETSTVAASTQGGRSSLVAKLAIRAVFGVTSLFTSTSASVDPEHSNSPLTGQELKSDSFVLATELKHCARSLFERIIEEQTHIELILPLPLLLDRLRTIDTTYVEQMGTVEVLLAHLKSEGKLLELTSLQDTKARVFKFSEEYSKSAILEDTGLAAGVYELTVARLRQSLDNLHRQKDLLAEKIAARKLDAKQLIRAGKKKLAVLRLRSKKQLEVYEKQLFGKMLNVERLLDAVVEATLNKQMLHSLESSNATLNDLTSQVAIEDVEDVLDENADLLSRLQAVDELLGQDLTFTEAEEQSLQDQLAELLSNDAPAIEEGKDVLSPRPQQQLNTSTTSVSTTQEGLQVEDRKQQLVVRPSTDKKRAIILS